MLAEIANRADELATTYGNVSKASVGTIQRALLQLCSQGGEHFFGEPALDIHDFMLTDDKGRGQISIPAADKLMAAPKLYPPSCCGCCPSCSRRCPRSAIRTSPSSSSSSTRRICCSTARRPRCWRRSSRWCA